MKSPPALRCHRIPRPPPRPRFPPPLPPGFSSPPAPAAHPVFHSTARGSPVPPAHCAPRPQKSLPRYCRLSALRPLPLSSFLATPHPRNATATQDPRSTRESPPTLRHAPERNVPRESCDSRSLYRVREATAS